MGTKTWFKFFKDTISGESVQGILSDRRNGDKAVVLFIYLLERFCDKDTNVVELSLQQTARRLWTTPERIRNCLQLICEHIEDTSLEFVLGSFRLSLPNYLERQAYGDKRREDKEKSKKEREERKKSASADFETSAPTDPPDPQLALAKASEVDPKIPEPDTPKKRPRKTSEETKNETRQLQEFWLARYEAARGFKYTVSNHGQFGRLAKTFRNSHGMERAKELVDMYLGWNRPQIVESGWEFGLLVKHVNAMLAEFRAPEAVVHARANFNATVQKEVNAINHNEFLGEIKTFAENHPPKPAISEAIS